MIAPFRLSAGRFRKCNPGGKMGLTVVETNDRLMFSLDYCCARLMRKLRQRLDIPSTGGTLNLAVSGIFNPGKPVRDFHHLGRIHESALQRLIIDALADIPDNGLCLFGILLGLGVIPIRRNGLDAGR